MRFSGHRTPPLRVHTGPDRITPELRLQSATGLKESLLTYYNETKNIAEGFAGRQMSKRVGVRTPVRRRCPCAPQKPAAAADFIAHRARPEMTGILPISIRSQCLQRSGHRAQVGRAGVRLAPGC